MLTPLPKDTSSLSLSLFLPLSLFLVHILTFILIFPLQPNDYPTDYPGSFGEKERLIGKGACSPTKGSRVVSVHALPPNPTGWSSRGAQPGVSRQV